MKNAPPVTAGGAFFAETQAGADAESQSTKKSNSRQFSGGYLIRKTRHVPDLHHRFTTLLHRSCLRRGRLQLGLPCSLRRPRRRQLEPHHLLVLVELEGLQVPEACCRQRLAVAHQEFVAWRRPVVPLVVFGFRRLDS